MVMDTKDGSGSAAPEAAKLPLSRLGAYLAIGAGILGTHSAEAEIVPIDIGPTGFNITGVNGGVAAGTVETISNFPISGSNILTLINRPSAGYLGLAFSSGGIAHNGGFADPRDFLGGTTIDSSFTFSNDEFRTEFRYINVISPAFGNNSYLGFRTSQGNYGWIKATWNGTDTFQLYSAAYESTPGVAIVAGDSGTAVPEIDPSGLASAMSLVMGSVAMLEQRRRKRAAAAAESAAVTA